MDDNNGIKTEVLRGSRETYEIFKAYAKAVKRMEEGENVSMTFLVMDDSGVEVLNAGTLDKKGFAMIVAYTAARMLSDAGISPEDFQEITQKDKLKGKFRH